jgi:hypothetical protein
MTRQSKTKHDNVHITNRCPRTDALNGASIEICEGLMGQADIMIARIAAPHKIEGCFGL